MLSSLASIPGGVASIFANRRKTFTWVAGTVGGAYLLGQWGLKRMGDMAEKARIEGADRDK
jgi:peroxin-3